MAASLPPLTSSALLVAISFLAGIGATTLGPGGIFSTIALYTLTTVSSSTVAGTAQLTFVGLGLLASVAYLRSGELAIAANVRIAIVLGVSSILGALGGAQVNTYVSRELFGLLLGGFTVLVGLVVIYREHSVGLPQYEIDLMSLRGVVVMGSLGLSLGAVSSLLGVGGPIVAVPVLVVLGVGMLPALAIAQVQAVFIATFATIGYALNDAVSLTLALIVGVPQIVGGVVGWRIAHRIDPARLKTALGLLLIAIGPYIAFR
jgi:hypothetical protein